MEIKQQGYGNHVVFRMAFTAHMRRAVLQSAFISQVAENEVVREACLVIQDLQFCSWRLEKCWPKDRECARVNIETVGCFIAVGARQLNSHFWSFLMC